MGASVRDNVNPQEFFSISSIDKRIMQLHGLNMSRTALIEKAKSSKPYAYVWTGSINPVSGLQRRTKVYRYKDFKK